MPCLTCCPQMISQCRSKYLRLHPNLYPSLWMDEICQAQAADDSLQPIIQCLKDQAKLPQSSLCQYPGETCVLLSQLDLLLLQDDVLYRKFHYLDGTSNFLQIVLSTNLRQSDIRWLHANLGHFEQTKTYVAVSHSVMFLRMAFLFLSPRSQLCSMQSAPMELPDPVKQCSSPFRNFI